MDAVGRTWKMTPTIILAVCLPTTWSGTGVRTGTTSWSPGWSVTVAGPASRLRLVRVCRSWPCATSITGPPALTVIEPLVDAVDLQGLCEP